MLISVLVLAVIAVIAGASVGVKNVLAVALSEEIIVFDAGGPIRGEAVLKAHTDHAAPTGPLCLQREPMPVAVLKMSKRWFATAAPPFT